MKSQSYGMIVGKTGRYSGLRMCLYSDETVWFGADERCDTVLEGENILPLHCGISYDAEQGCFWLVNESENGVFLAGIGPVPAGEEVRLPSGAQLQIGNDLFVLAEADVAVEGNNRDGNRSFSGHRSVGSEKIRFWKEFITGIPKKYYVIGGAACLVILVSVGVISVQHKKNSGQGTGRVISASSGGESVTKGTEGKGSVDNSGTMLGGSGNEDSSGTVLGGSVDAYRPGNAAEEDADDVHAETELRNWQFWGGLEVTYKGWAGLASIDQIEIEGQDKALVEKYISFEPAENYTRLKDGDKLVIQAIFDEEELKKEGLKIEEPSWEMTVHGIPAIVQASPYYDGVAWVEIKTGQQGKWSLVDLNGEVLYQLEAGSYPVTHYENGVCIVDFERIVDKSGNTIWSIEKDGYDYAASVWGADNVESIKLVNDWNYLIRPSETLENLAKDYFGYTQVEFEINTFEFSGVYTGFLDASGNWYLDPADFRESILDEEKGVYRVYDDMNDRYGTYKILTNELIWEDEMDKEEYSQKVNGWKGDYYANMHDGLVYDYGFGDAFFCDKDGNKVIDLSRYDIDSSPYPAFTDGYCMLRIKNNQGAYYYVVIDTSGKEMFEPRKREEVLGCCSDGCSEGFYWDKTSEDGVVYYTVNGEQAFSIEFPVRSGTEFREGRALIEDFDHVFYVIDTEGNLIY